MSFFRVSSPLRLLLLMSFAAAPLAAHASDPQSFRTPTREELSMTELPGYPGAAAVVLNRDEEDRDDLHVVKRYERIKILSEKGKDLANVELKFASVLSTDWFETGDEKQITDIEGRTIQPDGKIIPFTGKPYLKVIAKANGAKFQARVFTLPDVEVGSIIEYRYAVRIADHWFEPPDWIIQGDLFVKQAHYIWYPTTQELQTSSGARINSISWFPILPDGVSVQAHQAMGIGRNGETGSAYEVQVKDVPPFPQEEYMPPVSAFSYRVLFNFTEYHSSEEFWKGEGKEWSKRIKSFVEKDDSELRDITGKVTQGATSPEDKLHKIYAAVEGLENTDFTRQHGENEDKAAGMHRVNSAAEVYKHGRGSSDQLTELFIGMVNASGMRAYAMAVPDRSHSLFVPRWLSLRQLDDLVAVVNVDGKDVFFDPGARFTPYGHLAWQHTFVQGLRQVDGGTAISMTLGDGYASNRTTRVANLTMDERGEIHGKIDLGFIGSPAVEWRQRALRGDDESLKRSLREELEHLLPKSVDVKVQTIQNLDDYEKPLMVSYQVNGAVGTPTGKRLMVPADLFASGMPAKFSHEKREMAVYFPYAETVQDALRITLPANLSIEAVPTNAKTPLSDIAMHNLTVQADAHSFTTRRQMLMGTFAVNLKEYGSLRSFYSTLQAKDNEAVVLKQGPAAPAASTTVAGGGR